MTRNAVAVKNELGLATNDGKPLKSYIKTELGKVHVIAWDTYLDTPVGLLLEGNPRNREESCIIDMWSEREDSFFKKMNRSHFERGTIIPFERKEEAREKTVEESTDDELKEVLSKPFLALQSLLNKTESVALVFRLLNLAQEMEKSAAVIKAIESRLSELQSMETTEQSTEE